MVRRRNLKKRWRFIRKCRRVDEPGELRLQQKQYGPAKEAMMKALDADPKMASPYIQLGMLAAEQRQWEDAARNLDRALKLDPIDYAEAWYVDAVANFNLKLYDAAEASARQYSV